MPLFSFKRSPTSDSDSSTASSLPLNDTQQEPQSVPERQNDSNSTSVFGKFRNTGIWGSRVRHGRRSKSPINRSMRQRSRSPYNNRSDSQQPKSKSRSKLTEEKFLPAPTYRRLGTSFCYLCDMRIATALLNTIHMAVAVGMELVEASKWGNRNYTEEPPVLLLMAIGTSAMGLLGALHFLKTPLILSSIFLCFLWYLYLVNVHMFRAILVMMIVFAQLVLADEIRRGIMHESTYQYEEYIEPDGRKVIETVHGLSVDVGETMAEFAEEVKIEVRRQSSGGSQLGKQQGKQQVKQKKVEGC